MDGRYRGITVRGNSVQIAFTYEGQRCRETVKYGRPPTKTQLDQLDKMRSGILFDISVGVFEYSKYFPNSRSRASRQGGKTGSQITVKEALREWIVTNRRQFAKSTLIGYDNDIHNILIPTFGDLRLKDLKPQNVRTWIAEQPCSGKRINNILVPIRCMFAEAFENELIEVNPMERIRNLKINTREPQPFTLDEIKKILFQLEGQERNLIQFAFWSGLRTSELIELKWQDIDLLSKRVFVRRAKVNGQIKSPKTSSGIRTVDLNEETIYSLESQQAYEGKSGYVFNDPKTSSPWRSDQPIRKRVWIPAIRAANIEYRNPYQTRHTFASQMLALGRNPMWVSRQLGHKDQSMIFRKYGRYIPKNELT